MNEKINDLAADYAPTYTLDREPAGPATSPQVRRTALVAALEGIPLGEHDRTIVDRLANRDDGTVRTVVSLVRRAATAAFVAGAIQGEADARALDEEAQACPSWCGHHSDNEVAGERTHFGSRDRVGEHSVQAVEVRRLAEAQAIDGQTVSTRVFLGDAQLSVDEARRLARLLWSRAGELSESSTEWAGEVQPESLDDDRLRITMQHGVWAGRTLARAEADAQKQDMRTLVALMGEVFRRVLAGELGDADAAREVREIERQARAAAPTPQD